MCCDADQRRNPPLIYKRAAAEGDMAALDGMLAKLEHVPAPDGRTPRQIVEDQGLDGRRPAAE